MPEISETTAGSDGLFARTKRLLKRQRPNSAEAKSESESAIFSGLDREGEISGGTSKENSQDWAIERETRFTSNVWRLGRQDAGIGQPREQAEDVLKSKAELDWTERLARAQAAIHAKEAQLVEAEPVKERLEANVKSLESRLSLSSHTALAAPGRVAYLAWVYLGVGLLAFAGELPLSINLIDQGLRMNAPEQLTRLNNYSLIILAMILCIFGLAFKIAYDSGAEVLAMRKILEGTNEASRLFHQKRNPKLLFALVAAVLVVCCCASLRSIATFRNRIAEQNRVVTNLPKEGDMNNQQRGELEDANRKREDAGADTLKWLTITLPLFGAVSWISGAIKLQQNKEDRDAHHALKLARSELTSSTLKVASLRHEIQSAKERLAEEEREGKLKAFLLAIRLGIYRHGYGRGAILPEERPEGGFYDFHVAALRRWAGRQTRWYYMRSFSKDG